MTSVLAHPNVRAALDRCTLPIRTPDTAERLESACEHPEIEPDGILEISRADWGTESQSAEDVLVVQTRSGVFMIVKVKGALLRRGGMVRIRCLFEWYHDLTDDDEMAGASVIFLATPGHRDFLLSFPTRAERDRMFPCLFEAHRGHFARWGLQLDPAEYVADFRRYHAEIVAMGPDRPDLLYGWTAETYGDFDFTNALGLAQSWRHAELSDRVDPARHARVSMMTGGDTWWRADHHPEARRAIVELCAALYDEGLLAPPYDERTFTDEPLSRYDVGPRRLLALMTLAAYAHALGHPRAPEWVAAARAGIPVVPASVFADKLRELWVGIGALPRQDERAAAAPREVS